MDFYDADAELALIGSVVIDPSAVRRFSWIRNEMFSHPYRQIIWRAIEELQREHLDVDMITIIDRVGMIDESMRQEVELVIISSANVTPTSMNANSYASIILEKFQYRELQRIGSIIMQSTGSIDQIVSMGIQRLVKVTDKLPMSSHEASNYGKVIDMLHEDTIDKFEHEDMRIKTGFDGIDRNSGGFESGQLIIIAARPSQGKSALALSIARRMAMRLHANNSGIVEVVTMEMSAISQVRRIIAFQSGLDTNHIRGGLRRGDDIDHLAFQSFTKTIENEKELIGDSLAFYDGGMSLEQLTILATNSKRNNNLRVLIIDQLDLFSDDNFENETVRIGKMSTKLKRLAMQLNIVVIVLAQLNRKVEERAIKKPQLSDLRQSGKIEQDADIVYGIYRPSYYHEPKKTDHVMYQEWAELWTLKYRDGLSGIFTPLRFIGKSASFTDWHDPEHSVEWWMNYVENKESSK